MQEFFFLTFKCSKKYKKAYQHGIFFYCVLTTSYSNCFINSDKNTCSKFKVHNLLPIIIFLSAVLFWDKIITKCSNSILKLTVCELKDSNYEHIEKIK